MGYIVATIELRNTADLENARRGLIGQEEVRRIDVEMLVDTGSLYMCINDAIRNYLNLATHCTKKLQLADGTVGEFDMVGPLEVRFQNRICFTEAIVLPDENQCLLGAIPMEAMDVLISPARQELVVNPAHPDYGVFRL